MTRAPGDAAALLLLEAVTEGLRRGELEVTHLGSTEGKHRGRIDVRFRFVETKDAAPGADAPLSPEQLATAGKALTACPACGAHDLQPTRRGLVCGCGWESDEP